MPHIITLTNVDQVLWRHMASLSPNKLQISGLPLDIDYVENQIL